MTPEKLIRYAVQLALLGELLHRKLITLDEYDFIRRKLMKDYGVVSDITT